MPWVYAVAEAEISRFGEIDLKLKGVEVREGRRPIEPTEGWNPDYRALEAIKTRRSGDWRTPVFVGGATVVLAPFSCLQTLDPEGLGRLRQVRPVG